MPKSIAIFTKELRLFALVIGILWITCLAICWYLDPTYNPLKDAISYFGTKAPTAYIFNPCLIVTGLLGLVLTYHSRRLPLTTLFFGSAFVGLIFLGLNPYDAYTTPDWHTLLAAISGLFLSLGIIAFGLEVHLKISLIIGAIQILGAIVLYLVLGPTAVIEIFHILCTFVWIVLIF